MYCELVLYIWLIQGGGASLAGRKTTLHGQNTLKSFKGRHNKSQSAKVVGSKNVFNKSSLKFNILGGKIFFVRTKSQK